MSDETRDHDPAGEIRRDDELCDRFEDELKGGDGRSVEDFLRANGLDPATAPAALVRGLAQLEAEYRGFPQGTLLANRYYVERRLGAGGMGVVYLARDQSLGKLVALKFLSPRLSGNEKRRQGFKNEVLVAREVSHRHVCRVHDYHEYQGHYFLSMEYIEGTDLASLLKQQFHHLSEVTAVEYARQLCKGLAAAHERGLLHRDLKPQNVMIDAAGQVTITDFGLAGRVGSFRGSEVLAGTVLYQAPEQLAGKEVTARSDLYALGLVLYEMFTGGRAYPAVTREELIRLQREGPSFPAGRAELNPAIKRVILWCLEPDPAQRPSTVNEVLYRLLGVGRLPSWNEEIPPPGSRSHSLRVTLALFATALVGLFLAAWLNDHAALFRRALTERAPRDLSREARNHLRNLGYDGPAGDSASGFATDESLLKHVREKHPDLLDRTVLQTGDPPVMYFWYRQSPQPLAQRLAANDTSGWSMPGRVLPNEPPLRESGALCVFLNLEGRLLELHAVPPFAPPEDTGGEPNWAALFKAAGLEPGAFRETTEFRRVPPVHTDRQKAWEGRHTKRPELLVRVEAASYRGKPVYFHVGHAGQTDRLTRYRADNPFIPDNTKERWQERKNMLLGLIALPIGGWFAWRNWTRRRANPFGASVLAGSFIALGMLGWVLAAKHVPDSADELSMFTGMLGRVVFDGLLLWLAYLALEPWVRRTSPERVISWNRMLQGRWRDPLVGRDVHVGVVAAAGFVALLLLLRALPVWLGYAPDPKVVWDATFTEGAGSLILTVQIALMVALRGFFLFYLILLVCRGRARLAAGLNVALWAIMYAHGGDNIAVVCIVGSAFAAASLFVLLRAGLLGFVAFTLVEQVLIYMPVTTDLSAWYTGIGALSALFVVALATYGFLVVYPHRPQAAVGGVG